MNIAVIAKTRFPIAEPFVGGLESFTHTLCKEYVKCGHDVTLYAHADSDPQLNVISFYANEHRDSEVAYLYENDEYTSILKHIEQQNYDIVHNNSTHPLPIIWGAKADIPVVTTLHTPPYTALKAATSLASYSNNLQFVAVSKSLEKMWRPYLNNGSSVIYNGIDLDEWPMKHISSDYLFWYGRIAENKGLDIALDAAHELHMSVLFAGNISDQTYFDTQIIPRMAEGDSYEGHLHQHELRKRMKNAALFVCPIRWEEPFGLSTVEAMASGVPVAGFDRGAFREIVDSRSGVIASGSNVSSLVSAMKIAQTLNSSDVRARAEKFPLDQSAQQYLQFFKELL